MKKTSDGSTPKRILSRRILAMSLSALAGIAVSFLLWQVTGKISGNARLAEGTPASRHSGVADIGAPFSLLNQDGERVTDQTFTGHHMLIYFGYTWCPDVCPLALQFMDDALTRLGPDASAIKPVFITLDPERDTPEALKAYLASFSPDLTGLTGTPQEIAAIASAYKMYYRKTEPLSEDDPLNYGLDHMNIFYLMGPDGTYVTHFMSPTSPADVAGKLATFLK